MNRNLQVYALLFSGVEPIRLFNTEQLKENMSAHYHHILRPSASPFTFWAKNWGTNYFYLCKRSYQFLFLTFFLFSN